MEAHAHEFADDVYEPAVPETFNGKLAMWLFLCSEVMFFSALLGAYITLRTGQPKNFEASQAMLHHHVSLAAFNTALLISSSLTMALGVLAGQSGQWSKHRLYLLATAAMGTLFLILKAYEYSTKINNGYTVNGVFQADPLTPNRDLFFAFYWTLTGVHGLHILGGVIPIAFIAMFGEKKKLAGETEMVGLYWHFVDLVWIFLFPLLYLI